jgi:hypothetical protein
VRFATVLDVARLWGTNTSNASVTSELKKIGNADFVAFNSDFFSIIGPNATCEKMFNVSMAVHEAPCWVPDSNTIIISPQNQSYQIIIDLKTKPVRLFGDV